MPINKLYYHGNTVIVGRGTANRLEGFIESLRPYKIGIVTDSGVAKALRNLINMYLDTLPIDLYIELGQGEEQKSIENAIKLWRELYRNGFTRKSILIALGGGVIIDIVGFVASTYMRGIDYISIPTTLLSQADSCVGGKTGLDLDGKNVIGTFHPPKITIVDPTLLKKLPQKIYIQGISEIIKHGLLCSQELLNELENKMPKILGKDIDALEKIISESLSIKINIVNQDLYESGYRMILNLGHTIGHAIEAASQYTIPHGEAVSIGISKELLISEELIGFRHRKTIINILDRYGLPTETDIPVNKIMEFIAKDKKNLHGKPRIILLKDISRPVIHELPIKIIEDILVRT